MSLPSTVSMFYLEVDLAALIRCCMLDYSIIYDSERIDYSIIHDNEQVSGLLAVHAYPESAH